MGDITYIPTSEDWLYLATVKDLCTKKAVGYAFSSRIDTQLTLAALDMAVRREKPGNGFIFHSDRGVLYAAAAYQERLSQLCIRQSLSRKGDPYDNAVAENFFSCLKCELIHLTRFDARAAAQYALFAYIDGFYNALRPHSAIGRLSPNVFAKRFAQTAAVYFIAFLRFILFCSFLVSFLSERAQELVQNFVQFCVAFLRLFQLLVVLICLPPLFCGLGLGPRRQIFL